MKIYDKRLEPTIVTNEKFLQMVYADSSAYGQ